MPQLPLGAIYSLFGEGKKKGRREEKKGRGTKGKGEEKKRKERKGKAREEENTFRFRGGKGGSGERRVKGEERRAKKERAEGDKGMKFQALAYTHVRILSLHSLCDCG